MLPVLILALYLFGRRVKPEWSPWIIRGTVVILCVTVPDFDVPTSVYAIATAFLFGITLGYWYRETKSA
jgi:hypothetical protein